MCIGNVCNLSVGLRNRPVPRLTRFERQIRLRSPTVCHLFLEIYTFASDTAKGNRRLAVAKVTSWIRKWCVDGVDGVFLFFFFF